MDLGDFAIASGLVTLFVIGATELVKRAFAKDWQAVATIVAAAVIGGLAGWALPVVGVIVGVSLGLAGSGLITTVQNIGNKV